MISYLILGTIYGLSAEFSPGPLLNLVISETLKHDYKSRIKVAVAPFITDLPIIFLTLFVLSKLSAFQFVLGSISILGGTLIFHMEVTSIRTKGVELNLSGVKSNSLLKGILVQASIPHPYLFWSLWAGLQ
jgi:threonine/homoserine/homoserine lactone efflux protein